MTAYFQHPHAAEKRELFSSDFRRNGKTGGDFKDIRFAKPWMSWNCDVLQTTLWLCQNHYGKIHHLFMVNFPMKHGGSFHSYFDITRGYLGFHVASLGLGISLVHLEVCPPDSPYFEPGSSALEFVAICKMEDMGNPWENHGKWGSERNGGDVWIFWIVISPIFT